MRSGIDWHLVARVVVPFATLFVGYYLNRLFEARAKLLVYYGHISTHKFQAPGGQWIPIHTHAVVVSNAGRKPAHNMRLGHLLLQNYEVIPSVSYEVKNLPEGGAEIVLPILCPGEQVTVSYLYEPPTTFQNINTYVKSDEGLARALNVVPAVQHGALRRWGVRALAAVGAASILYVICDFLFCFAQA